MNGGGDQSESYGLNKKMMDESGMASLASLDEALSVNDIREHSSAVVNKQVRMLNTNRSSSSGGYEETKMGREGDERPSNALDNKYKLAIEYLPAEVLAICLSYTGKDLPNARLTCRRFNQIIEDYQYMMNVIPVRSLSITKHRFQDFLSIEQVWKCRIRIDGCITTCKLDELMPYVRFLRPQCLNIGVHFEATDMKNYLTDSWRKSIVKLTPSYEPILSIFPNVSELLFRYFDPSVVPLLLTQISAHPSPIHRFTLLSFGVCEESDLILDVLSKHSNKLDGGVENVHLDVFCSMEAIIRFIEDSKFAEKFRMSIRVKSLDQLAYDSVEGNHVFVENCGFLKFNNWIHSKGLQRSCPVLQRLPAKFDFVYRSTQFHLCLENFKIVR